MNTDIVKIWLVFLEGRKWRLMVKIIHKYHESETKQGILFMKEVLESEQEEIGGPRMDKRASKSTNWCLL
jgi:hypothetical protein